MQIWKYVMNEGEKIIEMPAESTLVRVNEQNGSVCIWAAVDPKKKMVKRKFFVVGTGQEFDERGAIYYGAAFVGPYVLHVLEREFWSETENKA